MPEQNRRNTAHQENFYYPDLWESREKAEREKQAELDLEMERSQVRFEYSSVRGMQCEAGRSLLVVAETDKMVGRSSVSCDHSRCQG